MPRYSAQRLLFPVLLLLLGLLSLASFSGPVVAQVLTAQGPQRVAAVVNSEAITSYELNQRIALALLSANQPDTPDARKQLQPDLLRRLIDEHLETQDAAKKKITVPDSSIQDAMKGIEQQNGMPSGALAGYLTAHGVDPTSLRQQLRAQLVWNEILREALFPQIQIGDDEIQARLRQLQANEGKPEYLAADIYLAVDNPSREADVKALADRIYQELNQGAVFPEMALQFSQSGASAGGSLGWVSPGMIDDHLMAALQQMTTNQVNQPIRIADGYHILLLRDKRIAGQGQDNEATFDIAAVDVATLPSATQSDVQKEITQTQQSLSLGKSCDDFERMSQRVPNASFQRLGVSAASQIPASVLQIIQPLAVGVLSDPVQAGYVQRFYVLCDRHDASKGLPSRDDIRRQLVNERIDTMSQGYLRDLRRGAFVEIRS